VESVDSPFTSLCHPGQLLTIPVAHGEGCYFADAETLQSLEENDRVLLRYVDAATGEVTDEANPNGSSTNIAGICNKERNVFGLMPHPDRASHVRLGSEDGKMIFAAMAERVLAPA
jgi:phosphoribosylformylglycinamidine synthase